MFRRNAVVCNRPLFAFLFSTTLLSGLVGLPAGCACAAPTRRSALPTSSLKPPDAVTQLDAPFLFAYGTWEKKVRIENGKAILRGEGVTPKGGAGVNVNLDLSETGDYCPALRVTVGPNNHLPTLKLLLVDANQQTAIWEFALPATGQTTLLTPKDGAAIGKPTTLDKADRPFDISKIRQWQLQGDWSSDQSVDVEVSAIRLIAPNADIRAKRAAVAQQQQAEREKQRQERENLRTKYGKRTANSPLVELAYLAAPDVLALEIRAGKLTPGSLSDYVPQTGDEKRPHDRQVNLVRGGQEIGWLVGPDRNKLITYEAITGDPLLDFLADALDSYSVRSDDDANFAQPIRPKAVYRKSKPTDWAQPGRGFVMRHVVYLRLPHSLSSGKNYTVSVGDVNVQSPTLPFRCDPTTMRSEAVHVNQIGYRPDDPVKRAFLSVWLGTGGAYRFAENLSFALVEDKTGKTVFTGKTEPAKAADSPELMAAERNFNGTNVYRMDFGAFSTPGRYRVVVAGVGCSYPFAIGNDTWQRAFLTQMRGLFNERSGMALGPPYTEFRKPRDFHPGDGVKIYESTYSALEKGGEAFADIAKGSTGKLVTNAWGGYHDAGDWNPRRATHLRVTRAQLELIDLFPQYFRACKLNIPPLPSIPDIFTEAMWEIDCFRRMQKSDGGIPYGIETEGDPIDGEVSWLQSMPAYVLAPDPWASWEYVSATARLARLIQDDDAKLSMVYRASALKAMQWAEHDYAVRKSAGTASKLSWEARDTRNLAALELYRLTNDRKWHDVFRENSFLTDPNGQVFAWGDHVQRDAAFGYARLPASRADAAMQERARRAILSQADQALNYASGNAFNLTTPDKGKPQFIGFYTAPDAIELVRAHFLTGKRDYLMGALQACQFGSGCNPDNLVYTTGLGANPIRHPLHLDSRRTGQPAPPGLTTYGPIDLAKWRSNFTTWPITYFLNAICTPSPYDWPTTEAYFDVFLYVAQNEFTVDAWSPNVYVWGYLAARQ